MPGKFELLTIGYAGHNPESFVSTLRQHSVRFIVDVRQNPVSRKKGFSKARLAEFLAVNGVEYAHLGALGVPRALRYRLRHESCTLSEYLAEYRDYVAAQNAAFGELFDLASRQRACLMCVESRPEECHRSVIADLLAALHPYQWPVAITHL